MLKYISYFAVGVFIGILAALFGLGGGFLIVPTLNLLGVEIHHAVGTSSAAVVFTSLSSALAYSRQKRVHYKAGLLLASTAIIGAYIGAWMTSLLNPAQLKVIFGATLILVAIRIYRKKTAEPSEVRLEDVKINYKFVPVGGFFAGIASGLLGVGGGIINVPFLVWLGMPIHYAVATSSFAIVFTATSGAIKHYMMGNVEIQWLVLLVPGLIIGAQLGARIAKRTKASNLKKAFAVVLALLALRMILKGLGIAVP
ncbi:sulfite exporter TauE/SafE family protein [Thermococcus sp. M39]|uniref:sulfite exporter TauE/SafE family protein n=1 Tax=unclassified Thermococcus TaxID=2627626 RepID=UPI00143A3810|nr:MULTISPECIES: sulfite exporter TauE/SafE family protein [unclassified Thermococcus]NJE07598.1 sulfite exporter TauE/SafE family protein [Thermococcus sp. M39]NJE12182.1 sulfite exporter TauE/SafE family protein [Thermococcus sp. LS2]